VNNKPQPTYENLNDPRMLAVQAKQIGQGSYGKAIADTALKNPQQFLSDSQQNLKTVKDVKPSEPKDEGWFENPEHQKGLAIATAGLGTALLGLALIISAPVSLPALIIGGAIMSEGLKVLSVNQRQPSLLLIRLGRRCSRRGNVCEGDRPFHP
jgi:hypothetical protein